MPLHPALRAGRTAVITGAASGIGLAAARRFAGMGMRVCLADLAGERLAAAAAAVRAVSAAGPDGVLAVGTDVSRLEDVQALKDAAYAAFGEVAVLMNNAGTAPGGGPWEHIDRWRRVLEVNLWGVINGVQAFSPAMLAQGTACAIVNTGSKQGITCPPGDAAYNVSKAGVKAVTEALAHGLRNAPGDKVSAHLLVPGSTFTGMTGTGMTGIGMTGTGMTGIGMTGSGTVSEKPAGAWSADQVVEMLVEGMGRGDFYIICPDNEVTREIDNRRILWAAGDIVENRPALSRWHPDYAPAFKRYVSGGE